MSNVPPGYHSLTPVLVVNDAAGLSEFLREAFGAEVRMRIPLPDGRVAHSELVIEGSVVMVDDASEAAPAAQSTLYLYVPDVDSAYRRALAAGATSRSEPADQFYGDRTANIVDKAGNLWTLATHREDVSEAEMLRRMADMR